MLFWLFVAGYCTCWFGTWLVNQTSDMKARRQAPIDNAYRAGYYNGLAEGHKLAIANQPPPPRPPDPEPPHRPFWRGRP